MYVVAFVAGADTYLIGSKCLVEQQGISPGRAQIYAAIIGAVLALIVATVPIAIYQRVMRRVVARRRAANLSSVSYDPAGLWTDPVDPDERRPAQPDPYTRTHGVAS